MWVLCDTSQSTMYVNLVTGASADVENAGGGIYFARVEGKRISGSEDLEGATEKLRRLLQAATPNQVL